MRSFFWGARNRVSQAHTGRIYSTLSFCNMLFPTNFEVQTCQDVGRFEASPVGGSGWPTSDRVKKVGDWAAESCSDGAPSMCMHYVYMYIYIYIGQHVYIYIYIHAYRIYLSLYIYIYMSYTHIQVYTHLYVLICDCTYKLRHRRLDRLDGTLISAQGRRTWLRCSGLSNMSQLMMLAKNVSQMLHGAGIFTHVWVIDMM